ncbi:hypothetical protein GH714_030253 [Hevea brasiliensis]|uniref:Pentatricopeptide repeat-containing protein n=1 Tax=Hevea brasiliensis TaxID=3981 RepID=A0A6A6LP93_HEVBR|nr:hypothetical protein GH714_030253 [Hevea brasiliensis]
MLHNEIRINEFIFSSVLRACAGFGDLGIGEKVHGKVIKCGFDIDAVVETSLLERIFVNMFNQSVASWTAMISCYNRGGRFKEALEVFVEMLESKVESNTVTMMAVLGPTLIELYAKCGQFRYCENVLHTIGKRNIVSWNMLISLYASRGLLLEALALFVQMQTQGLIPDSFSLSSSISACANVGFLQLGRQLHGYAIKRHILDEFVLNSLIDVYSKCGLMDLAYLLFDRIQFKSVVAWNSMICGFCQNGNSSEAINLFDQMYLNCLDMNEVTFLAAIRLAPRWDILKRENGFTTNSLPMTAQVVFDSMLERSVVSWSVMIAGYGMHGNVDASISLFTQMVRLGIKPNDITFMNILSACSHAGYVEEGKFYFNLMKDFGVDPSSEHFACMVDLLSRVGNLSEAYRIIKSMPFPAEACIWGALLNGCRIHRE